MSWVKLDDRYAHHPKILAAGPLAMALDVAAMCHAARHETDGHIPTTALHVVAPFLTRPKAMAAAAKLVEVGRWRAVAGGWQIHDFLAYNPSAETRAAQRAETEERREAANERMRRLRKRQSDASQKSHVRERDTPSPSPPRPAKGGEGDGGLALPQADRASPPPPSGPASPPSATLGGDADSAGQHHPPPDLTSTNADPGGQPNGRVQLGAALMAQVSAELDAEFGPDWRRRVPSKTGQTPGEFEAEREQKLREFEAKFAQELNENRSETDQEPNENRSETAQEPSGGETR